MDQTKASTAQAPPLLRTETAKSKESNFNLFKALEQQALKVISLAEEYSKTGSQEVRTRLNLENMHLHGQIHVFWDAMGNAKDPKSISQEQQTLSNIQNHVNGAIVQAAKDRGHSATYNHINDIRSSTGQTAGQHIYKKLIHPDYDTHQKLYDAVEENVKVELLKKGLDHTFFERLFQMASSDGSNSGTSDSNGSTRTLAPTPMAADQVPLRGDGQKRNDPISEKLAAAEKKVGELYEALLKSQRETIESTQRGLSTQSTLTQRTEEVNKLLLEVIQLEKQMGEIITKRDSTYRLYEGQLSDEKANAAMERSKNAVLSDNLQLKLLEIESLIKRLEKAKRRIQTMAEIQNQYDEKVWRIQKYYTDEKKKSEKSNRELERTKKQLAAAQRALKRLRK